LNTCCFGPCGKLIHACVFKAVMADWNRSNHFDTPCIWLPVFRSNIMPLHSRQTKQVVGSSETKLHGTTAKYLTVVILVTAHTWAIPEHWTTSYLQDVPNCAGAAPTRCPIWQKDTCWVRRAFLCPCWIVNTQPPEHEVSLPTLQWSFVTHEPGSSVGIVTKLWVGRRRNRGSIPNWYRRPYLLQSAFPEGKAWS
jgi:hypothetical protein